MLGSLDNDTELDESKLTFQFPLLGSSYAGEGYKNGREEFELSIPFVGFLVLKQLFQNCRMSFNSLCWVLLHEPHSLQHQLMAFQFPLLGSTHLTLMYLNASSAFNSLCWVLYQKLEVKGHYMRNFQFPLLGSPKRKNILEKLFGEIFQFPLLGS